MHSTIGVSDDFAKILVVGDAIFHSVLKLIFLAASNLAQLTQRLLPEGNSVDNSEAPHFLHVSGIISTSLMNIVVASYKEETECPGLANQSRQNGFLFNGLESRCVHSYWSDGSKGSIGFARSKRR
jgi:hypothetical protein